MNNHATASRFTGIGLIVLTLLALILFKNHPAALGQAPSPEESVQAAWQNAQKSGAYQFSTELVQTTFPAPLLVNVGRTAQEDYLYIHGQTDLSNKEMLMTLWDSNGNPATGENGVEIRIQNDEAYGRSTGEDWQKINNFASAFAPRQDLLAYLAGAKNVSLADESIRTLGANELTQYTFELDGPQLGRFVRDQLEQTLNEKGELPAGLTLNVSNQYLKMTGSGRVWLTNDHLPARLTILAAFPQQENGQRIAISIKTDFSGFAPIQQAGAPWLAIPSELFSAKWGEIASKAAGILPVFAIGMLILTKGQSKRIYAGVALTTILTMVFSPLYQSQKVYAFTQENAANSAEADQRSQEAQERQDNIDSLYTSTWDPHQSLDLNANQPAYASAASALRTGTDSLDSMPANMSLKAVPAVNTSTSAAAASDCSASEATKDSDSDGLNDCQEKNLGTMINNSDSDSDGLSDGQEVLFLGLDPLKQDSDGDRIFDRSEVTGFSFNGKQWYTDPKNPDTNKDGLTDGVECPALTPESKNTLACLDTDGDLTPDIFDGDNDGDGVSDRADLSPFVKMDGFTSSKPFIFQANSIEANRDIFVDFQIRPTIPEHLTFAMNVLDWPADDKEGQVTRILDTTFASSLSAAQAAADPSADNGDMRLTPMLEIMMNGEDLPLPRTDPGAVRKLTASANGWLNATVNLAQESGQSTLTIEHDLSSALDEVTIYEGGCISATELTTGAQSIAQLNQVVSKSIRTINKKLLLLVDGEHAMTFKEGDQLACLSLGDLPNGKDQDKMIDTATLGDYGISIRDVDTNGTVVAYAPLTMVNDQVGNQRQAFSAQMVYRQNSTKWGNAQKIRLVWLVQLLGDDGGTQTIHVYKDDFSVTGLTLREDHGMNASVAFEDPKKDLNKSVDDYLWQVAQGLQGGFISGRSTNNQRDLTLSLFKQRFDNPSSNEDAMTKRWAIPAGKVVVLNYSFANQNGLAAFPAGENQKILNQYFMENGSQLSNAPALIIAREEMYRTISLDSPQAQRSDTQVTLAMDKAAVPEQTLAAFNLAAFRYTDGSWQSYPLSQYIDLVGANYKQYFLANPVDFLPVGTPNYDQSVEAMVLVARSNQMALMNGMVGLVASGSQALSNEANIDRDIEVAGAVGGGLNFVYSVISGLAGDYFQSLANKSFAIKNLPKGGELTKAALESISKTVEEYQKAGEKFRGNFANSPGWGYAGMGIGAACIGLSIAAAVTGNEAVEYVALVLNVISSLYGLVDAIAKLTVNLAIKAATAVTDLVKGAASVIEKASAKSGAIGLIISSAIAVGLFIYQMVASKTAGFSLAFDAALAGLIGQIAVAVLMLVIASIPVVGQLIAAILAVIDSLIALICKATGGDQSENKGVAFVCSGISGMLASVFTYYFYASVPLVGNLKADDRLSFLDFKPTLSDSELGFSTDNDIQYALTVRNKIVLTDPLNPPDIDVPNWKSLAYLWQFKESNLRKAAFTFDFQTTETEPTVTFDSMHDDWQNVPGAERLTLVIDTPLSLTTDAGPAGLNQPAKLYLTEAYQVPNQECWALGLIPICYIRSDSNINHNDIGANMKWDIFPASLTDFYLPTKVDEGYSLAWGQSPAAEGGVVFPRMKDFDGDGLINKTDGGIDPDDSTWDTDGDGLSDPYELAHGSDPQKSDSDSDTLDDYLETRLGTDLSSADSDSDGLTDPLELAGWEIVYGFDSTGAALKTWVSSNPIMADADGDLILDSSEKILGTNPNVVSSSLALSYQTKLRNLNAASVLLRFEETTNQTSFSDSSIQGHNAICSGLKCPVSGVEGTFGNAVQFDGSDDVLLVSNPPDLRGAAFSIAFWAKRNTTVGSQWIVSQKSNSTTQALNIGFNSSNKFVCGFGGKELIASTTTIDHIWHHWACTYNAATRIRAIFLDGVQLNSDSPPADYQGTGDLLIGNGVGGAFNGQVDELGLYNSAFLPEVLQKVFTARYETNDTIVRPGDLLEYTGTVKNELNNRTAQGLLQTETNSASVVSQVPPTTFIVAPAQSQNLTGVLAVNSAAPDGPVTISQVAGGQVVDWRSASNNAELWLKMDESTSASKFTDSSGGQPARLTVCSGVVCPKSGENGSRGYAALFDGVDDTLNVNNSENLKPNFLTIAGWAKANSIPESGAPIAAKGVGSNGNLWSLDFYNNKPRMMISTVSGGSASCLADQTLFPSAWVHLAGTYNGSAMTLYVNGKEVKSCPVSSGSILAGNDHIVTVGSRQSGSGSYDLNFGGWLDDVRIFSKSMTANEINTLFAEPAFALDFEGSASSASGWLMDGSGGGSTTSCVFSANCPSQVQGMTDKSAVFSGQNYLQTTNASSNLDLSAGLFTQTAWIYPEEDANMEGILGYQSGEVSGSPAIQRMGRKLVVGFGTPAGWKTFATGDVLTTKAWNHIAATFDGTTYRIYVNGTEAGSSETLKGLKPSASSTAWLGRTSNTGTIYVNQISVKNEKDGAGDAELCMAWQKSPSASYEAVWDNDSGEAGKSYSINKTLNFTDSGTLKMWEDDGGKYCGANKDSSDDFIWSATFNIWDTPAPDEATKDWSQTEDSTGSITLGKNAAPKTAMLKFDSSPFTGKIDTVRVYRYAMTAEQVSAIYQAGTQPLLMHLDDPAGAGLSLQGFSNTFDTLNKVNGVCISASSCPTTGVPGRVGSAALFDGADDVIEIPALSGMGSQYLSVSAWVKPNAWKTAPAESTIFSSANSGFSLSVGSSGKPSFKVMAGSAWCETIAATALTLESWAHLAGTYDGSKASLYINGSLTSSKSCSGAVSYPTTPLYMGRNPTFPSSLFTGSIDEARVYNISLSPAEILAQVQAAPALVLHLDEKANSSGFSNAASTTLGTCSGAACPAAGAKGQVGLSAQFDGLDDSISFADSQELKPVLLTAAAWIKANTWAKAVSDGVILSKSSTSGGNKGYTLSVGNNGQASFAVSVAGSWCEALSQPVIAIGSWTHLAGSFDGTKASLYINGSLQNTSSCSGAISHATTSLTIGQSPAYPARRFNGYIDEVTVHASALSIQEIKNLYSLQAKYVEDRVESTVIIDNLAPVSTLESFLPGVYIRPQKPQILGITAQDNRSGIAMVELGVCSLSGSCTWKLAQACMNTSAASWCPTFSPSAEGTFNLKTRATDTNGLQETPSQGAYFVIDGTPPALTTDFPSNVLLPVTFNAALNAWGVSLSGHVDDPGITGGNPGSGAKNVWVTLYDSGGKMVSSGEQTATVKGNHWTINYAFDAKVSGSYTLKIAASDRVGNNSKTKPLSLPINLDGSAPLVTLDLSSLPNMILPSGTTLNGSVIDPTNPNGTAFGIQQVDTAFLAETTALYNDIQPPAGVIRHFPFDDQLNPQGQLLVSDLIAGKSGGCEKPSVCPGTGAQGHSGTALHFDGVDDVMHLGDQIPLYLNSFTFSTRAKRSTLGTSMLIGQGTNTAQLGFEMGFNSSDQFVCGFTSDFLVSDASYTDTDWHQWACTFDRSSKSLSLYQDGQKVKTYTAQNDYLGIGDVAAGRGMASTSYFGGEMDDLYVFNRALNTDEVYSLFSKVGPGPSQAVKILPFETQQALGGSSFDQNSWTLLTGSSDHTNKITMGKVGSFALKLDGTDDVAVIKHQTSLNFDNLTVAGWINPSKTIPDGTPLAAKGSVGSQEAWTLDFISGKPRLFFYISGTKYSCQADTAVATNSWTHVAGLYNGISIQLFINGALSNTCNVSGENLAQNTAPITVGARQKNPDTYDLGFTGMIDDIRLYRRAISAQEVKELFYTGWQPATLSNSGNGEFQKNLAIAVPTGLEGNYRLALRSVDKGGNFDTSQAAVWSGSLDTLAPRATLTRTYPTNNSTLYVLKAEDFNLKANGLTFSQCGLIPQFMPYQSAWYLAMIGFKAPQDNRVTASCTAAAKETLPVSAAVCDLNDNCTNLNLGAGEQIVSLYSSEEVFEIAATILSEPSLNVSIDNPADQHVFTSDSLPITVEGVFNALNLAKDLTVTVDSAAILTQSWLVTDAVTSHPYTAQWVAPSNGAHTIEAVGSDFGGNTVTATSKFFVDSDIPKISITTTPQDIWFDANGGAEIRGLVSDDGGIAKVLLDVSGPVNVENIVAVVKDGEWVASWPLDAGTPIDGVDYTFTATVTDMAGNEATAEYQNFTVDLTKPVITINSVEIDGNLAEPGLVITKPSVNGNITIEVTDNSTITSLMYAWTATPTEPEPSDPALVSITPKTGPITIPTTLAVTNGSGPARRYLYIAAVDSWNTDSFEFWGPIYQDPVNTPDYTGMNEPSGPFSNQPYREWMTNGCTLLGKDSRVLDKLPVGNALNIVQNLFATWDHQNLRLTWTGANWDQAGDLFIYLDTTSGGSYLAYNPYPATQENTILLLPATSPDSGLLADYAVWVQNSQTATLLKWNDSSLAWEVSQDIPLAENDGDWGYHFSAEGPNYTDLSLPFTTLGITDPLSGTLGLVAFASDENALRMWSVMPPNNHANSALVTHLAPAIGHPSKMQLTEQYTLSLGDDLCQQDQGRLQFEISANPGGLNFSRTNDDTNLLIFQGNQTLFDPFDDAYQHWLVNDFCPTNYWFPECRANKTLTSWDFLAALSTFTQVDFPPIEPNQAIAYTIRFENDSPRDYQDIWAEITTTPDSITWDSSCNLIQLGDVSANSEGLFTIGGVANNNGAGKIHVQLIHQVVGFNQAKCSYTDATPITDVEIIHISDKGAPSDVTILSPRTVIGPDVVHFEGSVADAAHVPTINLQITGPKGSSSIECPDLTPGDGRWACDWDVPASNGGTPPAEGDIFTVRAQATDVFGKVSEWSPPLSLKVDATAPALTQAENLMVADVLLTAAQPAISGTLSDNAMVKGVEVCAQDGSSCSAAEIIVDPATIPTTEFVANDIPDSSIPIPDSTQIDACTQPLVRVFTIQDTFEVANLQVGVSASHPYRGDLEVTLESPLGTKITLMGDTDNNRQNLDVLWSDFAWELIDEDWIDHKPDGAAYRNLRKPLNPLRTFYGEQANGDWTLTICDMFAEDSGNYLNSRLLFNADLPAANTQASWRYELPNGTKLDNATINTTVFGIDEAGNLSPSQALTFQVDNVSPQLTVTQTVTKAIIAAEIPVLLGTVADGSTANVFVIVEDPLGVSSQENVLQSDSGAWTFKLKPTETGIYRLIANAMDGAGNITAGGTYTIEVIEPYQAYLAAISKPAALTISGQVQTRDGSPLEGVTIQVGSAQTTTGEDGVYSILAANGTYSITPLKSGFTFTPAQQTISVPPLAANVNFTAEGLPTPTPMGQCPNLLLNPGFENGDLGTGQENGTQGWVFPITSYRAGFSTSVVYAGARSARIGIDVPGDDRYSYSSVWQQVDIPTSASQAEISFYLSFASTEALRSVNKTAAFFSATDTIDQLAVSGSQYVVLYDADSGEKIKDLVLPTVLNDASWRAYSFTFTAGNSQYDLNAIKNRHLKLYFGVYNTAGNGMTAMYVDNAVVTGCK